MENATPTDLISPDAALALWRELRPDAPGTTTALYHRAQRGGIPYHLTDGPGPGRVQYSASELTSWLLGPRALLGLRYLALAESITSPDPPFGDLDGAERRLREREGKAVRP